MGTAAELSAQIKVLYSVNLLTQLTQSDGSLTTINDTVLDAASNRALGDFQVISGFNADTSTPDFYHISALEEGVLYHLMKAKEGFFNMAKDHKKNFYAAMRTLRETAAAPVTTSSPRDRTLERQNSKVDMDLSRAVMQKGNSLNLINERNTGGDC